MYARVVTWEGGDADAIRSSAAQINEQAAEGPPEGLPAVGFLLLISEDERGAVGITLFETEQDMQEGHETLEGMSPPGDGMGQRMSVKMYEVAVDIRRG